MLESYGTYVYKDALMGKKIATLCLYKGISSSSEIVSGLLRPI